MYFKIEGVIYDATTKYDGLIKTIALKLEVNTIIFELVIKYLVSDRCPSLNIHNDMGVQVYLDQKNKFKFLFKISILCNI